MTGLTRGWCPSAHYPMMSGDGLLVRVKPRLGRLSATEMVTVADLAQRFGNGIIDLTSRANLQIRGVAEPDHPALLAALIDARLVDADPVREARRMVLADPCWQVGDLTDRLATRIESCLNDLAELPGKVGIAFNLGPNPTKGIIGDFRFETGLSGPILRADGASHGRPIDEESAVSAFAEMAEWFLRTGGRDSGRMARHLQAAELPETWRTALPKPASGTVPLGPGPAGVTLAVPFGATDSASLTRLATTTGARHFRVTPWRTVLLEDTAFATVPGFPDKPEPLLEVAACPGAPACAQASVPTRDVARRLASQIGGSLHVSGCPKGCARQTAADITLVGRNGRFDLVRGGRASDTPERTGLTEADLAELCA